MTLLHSRVFSVFLLLLFVCAADAATHDVYAGDLIQPVINASSDGDIIQVHPGRYYENIDVNQTVDLIGDDADLVAANNSSSAIYVTADHAAVSGFSVTGATNTTAGIYVRNASGVMITGNTVYGNYHGIHVENSSYSLIDNNNFDDNIFYDVAMINTSDTIVSDNMASNAYFSGIGIMQSCNNTIRNNTINNNTNYAGLFLYTGCNNNTIDHNTVNNNAWYGGILLFNDCSNNTIANNNISNNTGDYGGITSYSCGSNNVFTGNHVVNNTLCSIRFLYSSGNLIYNNVFTSNVNHVEYNGINTWNITPTTGPNIIDGPEIGGNYWSDYTGNDTDNDGFGDTPYLVAGASYDNYPLVHTHVLCGDVVADNEINILDLTSLLNIVVAGDMIDPCVGDTDGNRDLNILDVRRLIMYINDPTSSPLGCGC